MARLFDTSTLKPGTLTAQNAHWVYNALDSMVTHEVFQVLSKQLDPEYTNDPERYSIVQQCSSVYRFERACQAVAMEMMVRGILVDQYRREILKDRFRSRRSDYERMLDKFGIAVLGKPLNPRSHIQCKKFFYEALSIPVQYNYAKGERKPTTNAKALETIKSYMLAAPAANCILAARFASKRLSTLEVLCDSDGRMRTSYNVGGTETGRWSSSESIFGTGDNMQNQTDEVRRMYIADPGYKFAYPDYEQAESRVTGLCIFRDVGDSKLLDACESGDLHTTNAQLIWPELGWSNDPKENRQIANKKFWRQWSYRDLAKRGGHKLDYNLYNAKPYMTASQLNIPANLAAEFHQRYYAAYPGIERWQRKTIQKLQAKGYLVTLLGRVRFFWGNRRDEATWREAIAFEPQSVIGDITNLGLCKLQETNLFQLLGQTHDSGLFQFPTELELELKPIALDAMATTLHVPDRSAIIPVGWASGWNWAKYADEEDVRLGRSKEVNLDGIREWSTEDNRDRTLWPPESILHRPIYKPNRAT